ncbi:MAG TPA: Smr/MutS family protein [Terriglobales bacterium]|jgi:hypothetical protein
MGTSIRVVNLEQGFPSREQAFQRLDEALRQAKKSGTPALKIIHGYGSSGVGGILRFAVRNFLRQRKEAAEIKAFIPGESWSQFEKHSRELLQRVPESLLDSDLGRNNKGMTLVLL